MIELTALPDLTKIEHTFFEFSGGEIQVRITNPNQIINFQSHQILQVTANLTDSNSIFQLALLVDAIRRINHSIKLELVCPYLPYARQDRSCADGEALSLRVMTDFINNLNFESVTVWDCHSDVGLALLNRVTNIGPERFLGNLLADSKDYVLVSPDAGAMKKVSKVAKEYNIPMLVGGKNRNPITGEITGSYINYESAIVSGRKLLIVDDIMDRGRTFIELAKVIKLKSPNTKVELYITHCILPDGPKFVLEHINKIYSVNFWPHLQIDGQYLLKA